ncbi:hypothetical protein TRICI_006134 [Trichomonascus ciferrii]|uniref:Uncharacterized protein n=1 Tax=Trichomonascus ciferrii TaxID=44093 RepID=A0A642UMJ7_9ASCO|nr:hypothetical protein TRICI_006134 [Trichomonascus ciferrii]
MYDYESEASKVIGLRDSLLKQAENADVLNVGIDSLDSQLQGLARRYRRFVIEKEINQRREDLKHRANWRHDGKLHLLEPDEIEESSISEKRLKQAVKVVAQPEPPVAPYQVANRRPPPPPSDLLPYEDDYKPPQPSVQMPSAQSSTEAAGEQPLIPGFKFTSKSTGEGVETNPIELSSSASATPQEKESQQLSSGTSIYTDASPGMPDPTSIRPPGIPRKRSASYEDLQPLYSDEQPVPKRDFSLPLRSAATNTVPYEPQLPSATYFPPSGHPEVSKRSKVNPSQPPPDPRDVFGTPSYGDECPPY